MSTQLTLFSLFLMMEDSMELLLLQLLTTSTVLWKKNLKRSYSNLLVANYLLILICSVSSNWLGFTASSTRASGCPTDSTWKSTRNCQTRRSANVDETSRALSSFSSYRTVQYRWPISSWNFSQSVYHALVFWIHHASIVIHRCGWRNWKPNCT